MQNRTLKDQFMLRLPDGWRETLKDKAERNHRSLNSEILAVLEPHVSVSHPNEKADAHRA
ncbi:Arc family DNA-binding protein [Rhizobium sp. LjRoot30]|uniref:Arc family DNA-binding protein n=1 Tax=Rhizobium sp. LjRoot30 TaxID=3342320 RepID=UPI003F4FD7AE